MAQTFYIHNTARSPHTREVRRNVSGPESSTKNLFIGGGLLRVVRGRPMPVAEAFLRKHVAELLTKESKGLIAVYNAKTQRVDLSTLAAVPEAPPPDTADIDLVSDAVSTDGDTVSTAVEDAPVLAQQEDVLLEDYVAVTVAIEEDVLPQEETSFEESPVAIEEDVPEEDSSLVEEAPVASVPSSNPFFSGKKKNKNKSR